MERRRLQLETKGWDFQPERLLDEIALQPGWTCLDLECGSSGLLVPLSRRVGPAGFVVGVDADTQHLAAVRALVQDERLSNVEILKRNVRETGLPREAFDFVRVRLASTSSEHREELLAEAIALTRPGGVVAIQCSAWLAGHRARSIEVWGRKQSTVTRARARTEDAPGAR